MLIQPWIVLAEIFNFLILVAVLQRFLYKPIMRAMAQRERSISDRLQSAEAREAAAQTTVEQYEQLQADWSEQTKARQRTMHQQLEAERTTQLENARTALQTQQTRWNEALRQEQKACLVDLRDRARSQLIQSVRAALQTLANISLEQQMVAIFLTQLHSLIPADFESLQATVAQQEETPQWTIRTTFPLESSLQQQLVAGIQAHLPAQVPADAFTFETYPEYPCGIELRTHGYKLAWHLEHYLDSLESRLADALDPVPVL